MIAHREPENTYDYYWVLVHCHNCNLEEELAFYKGNLVIEYECPDCNCKTLETIINSNKQV